MAAIPLLIWFLSGQIFGPHEPAQRSVLVEKHVFGSFNHASRILIGPQGWIYVLDRENNSVNLFKEKNAPPITIGGYGWGSLSFNTPSGLASDGLNVYVSDFGNHRILRFDRNLNIVSTLDARDSDNESGKFGYPTGLDLSNKGELFILDSENRRVVRFSPQSRFVGSFGEKETRLRRLLRPIKIVVTHADRIYVLEPNRIVEYDYFGNYVRSFGENVLSDATGLFVDEKRVVVTVPTAVLFFHMDGTLKERIEKGEIVTSHPLDSFEDVLFVGGELFLLTKKSVHVFEIR